METRLAPRSRNRAQHRACRRVAEAQYQSTMDSDCGCGAWFLEGAYPVTSAAERPLLAVVDDDESVRESLPDLLNELGFASQTFSSAEAFLSSACLDQTRCLILDIAMPGMTGLDLQAALRRDGRMIPIVFITAQRDKAIHDRAFRQGAIRLLLKPFSDTALLEAVTAALQMK